MNISFMGLFMLNLLTKREMPEENDNIAKSNNSINIINICKDHEPTNVKKTQKRKK